MYHLFFLCMWALLSTYMLTYLFRWSKRKRNVTRLGSGSDSSKFNIQLSLATLSDRAAQKERHLVITYPAYEGLFLRGHLSLQLAVFENVNSPVTYWCRLQNWGRAHQWRVVLAALWSTASRSQRWRWRPSHSSSPTRLYDLQERDGNSMKTGGGMITDDDDKKGKHFGTGSSRHASYFSSEYTHFTQDIYTISTHTHRKCKFKSIRIS